MINPIIECLLGIGIFILWTALMILVGIWIDKDR